MVVDSLMDAVAGARRTGRLETGGVPPKPPATTLLSLWPSVFWDFGSVVPEGVAASSPTRCRGSRIFLLSLWRLRHRVAAQAGRTSHCDVSAPPVSSELPDGCTTHVLGLRIVVSVAFAAPVVLTVEAAATCFFQKLRPPFCLLLWQQQSTTPKTLRRPLCQLSRHR